MNNKLRNAKGLYLEGIGEGKVREAVTKYTGERYTQHSTGVADGIEGFVTFFEPFIERFAVRDIQVVRSIVDGRYVFCHVYQNLDEGAAKWVTADLFETDEDDKIIEHWDVIQEYVEKTASGRSMVDGPSEIVDLEKTDENKKLVARFCQDVLIEGYMDAVTQYISEDQYDQHNPTVADGLDGFRRRVQALARKGIKAKYAEVHRIVGQGNFVVAFSRVVIDDNDWCVFDIFRLKSGMIVEHWDVQEKILPKEQWGNSGKF